MEITKGEKEKKNPKKKMEMRSIEGLIIPKNISSFFLNHFNLDGP